MELATETELDVVDTGGWLTAGLWSGMWRTGGCTEGGDRTKMRGVLGTLRRFGVAKVSSGEESPGLWLWWLELR